MDHIDQDHANQDVAVEPGFGKALTNPAICFVLDEPMAQDAEKKQTFPLARAFAHADQRHARPLANALRLGFSGIELDVWLINGVLRVGHDLKDAKVGPTLEDLYFKPLQERVKENGGSVYPEQQAPGDFQLMLDLKQQGPLFDAVCKLLEKYKDMLTTVHPDGTVTPSAVTVILSGYSAREKLKPLSVRYAVIDGRVPDLPHGAQPSFIPIVSDNWALYFTWRGHGAMPKAEKKKLHDLVAAAHANGQRLRFWNTPELKRKWRDAVWRELVAAGVDYIGTDHPQALGAWLVKHDPHPAVPEIKWMSGPKP